VFHLKFGSGVVAAVDGNKLTVDFDKAGRKMVLESYVEAGWVALISEKPSSRWVFKDIAMGLPQRFIS
jgi:hypothetical protein